MEKKTLKRLIFAALLVLLFVTSCAPASAPTTEGVTGQTTVNSAGESTEKIGSSHFICYQSGQKIVDTKTQNGAYLRRVTLGDWTTIAWVWDDADGHNVLPYDGTICRQITSKG